MDNRLKEHIHPQRFIALLAALTALFGLSSFTVADIFVLPLAAFYALLLRFEPKKKIFSMVIACALVGLSFLGGISAVYSVCAGLCCGLLLWSMYRARFSKADMVFAITAFFTLYLFVALFLTIGGIQKDYSLSAAFAYYEEFIEQQRISFISELSQIKVADESGNNHFLINQETAEQIFLSIVRLTISFFIIAAFALCGIVCKIFTRMAAYAEKEDGFVKGWVFLPSSIFAYFYIGVYIASLLSGGQETVFGFTVSNLMYVFMAVFAYIGIRRLITILKNSGRRSGILIVFALIILLSVSAMQILSFLGVYTVIVANRVPREE